MAGQRQRGFAAHVVSSPAASEYSWSSRRIVLGGGRSAVGATTSRGIGPPRCRARQSVDSGQLRIGSNTYSEALPLRASSSPRLNERRYLFGRENGEAHPLIHVRLLGRNRLSEGYHCAAETCAGLGYMHLKICASANSAMTAN